MIRKNNKFGVCLWHPEQGVDLIHPDDFPTFPLSTVAIFHCVNDDNGWLTVEYGSTTYRVKPEVFKIIPTPKFLLGQTVFIQAKNMLGEVSGLAWHFKRQCHIYMISFIGKKSSRRYSDEELSPIP